jgi:hypothetical protein
MKKYLHCLKKRSSRQKENGPKGYAFMAHTGPAVIRHTLDTNGDRLEHIANYDVLLRKILGVHVEKFGIEETAFAYQTLVDNVSMIDDELWHQINLLVVEYGHNRLNPHCSPFCFNC